MRPLSRTSTGEQARIGLVEIVSLGDFFSAAARREHGLLYGVRIGLYPGEIDRLW